MTNLWSRLTAYVRPFPTETRAPDDADTGTRPADAVPHGDMVETVRACDAACQGARPHARVLLSDRAVYMDPWCAATIVAQLANHALSVLAEINLLGAATAAAEGDDPMPAFKRFALISLVLATVPKTVAAYTGQKWQHAALKRYDKAFIADEFRRPRTWVMRQGDSKPVDGMPAPNQEAVRTNLFKENLRWRVAGTVDATRQLIDDAGEAVINGAFFGFAVGPRLTGAMVVAVALTQGLGWATKNAKAQASRARGEANTQVFAKGKKVWDNLVLGNPVNRDTWLPDLLQARETRVQTGAIEHTGQLQRAWGGAALAATPMVWASLHHAYALTCDTGVQSLATRVLPLIPRLVGVVKNVEALRSSVWDRYLGMRRELRDTLTAARARPSLDLDALIKPALITVNRDGRERSLCDAGDDLFSAVRDGEPGRWTLRGPNTAGKSMTLLQLKEAAARAPSSRPDVPPGAALLPAKSNLSFAFDKGSSGESGLAHLRELVDRGPAVLLIDEVSAHLDDDNIAETERYLDTTAQTRTVVDIRHR